MNLLCTHPGRHGDLLWALPTVRALHEAGHTVDLALSPKYSSLQALIQQQAYVRTVQIVPDWDVREDAPISPRMPRLLPTAWPFYGRLVHLGYDGWPQSVLPRYVYDTVQIEHPSLPIAALDLERPWITTDLLRIHDLALGFSDEWFELKYGIYSLVAQDYAPMTICAVGSRWDVEGGWIGGAVGWEEAAARIAESHYFLGCCSALHVLACAVGTPCVIVEPSEARWNPIFWPFGMDGPRVRVVRGTDGRPTFDARHVRDAVADALKGVSR